MMAKEAKKECDICTLLLPDECSCPKESDARRASLLVAGKFGKHNIEVTELVMLAMLNERAACREIVDRFLAYGDGLSADIGDALDHVMYLIDERDKVGTEIT